MDLKEEHPHRYVATDYYVPKGKEPDVTRHMDGRIDLHCSTWKYGWRFSVQLDPKDDAHLKSVRALAEAFGLRPQPPKPKVAEVKIEVKILPLAWAPETALLRRAREINVLAGEPKHPATYRRALELLVGAVTGQTEIDVTQEEFNDVDRQMKATAGDDRYHQEKEE